MCRWRRWWSRQDCPAPASRRTPTPRPRPRPPRPDGRSTSACRPRTMAARRECRGRPTMVCRRSRRASGAARQHQRLHRLRRSRARLLSSRRSRRQRHPRQRRSGRPIGPGLRAQPRAVRLHPLRAPRRRRPRRRFPTRERRHCSKRPRRRQPNRRCLFPTTRRLSSSRSRRTRAARRPGGRGCSRRWQRSARGCGIGAAARHSRAMRRWTSQRLRKSPLRHRSVARPRRQRPRRNRRPCPPPHHRVQARRW